MGTAKKAKLFGSWFCPFVQRAWIAAEEKQIPYEYVEVDPYAKPKELLDVNPRGLVPAMEHHGKAIYESMVLIEYIDEAFGAAKDERGPAVHLMPSDPFDRAVARMWMDYVNRKVVPTFYRYLQRQEEEEQEEARADLLKAYGEISKAMSDVNAEGPFFFGSHFTLADITLAPWLLRHNVLSHYRGFKLPETPELARLAEWLEAVAQRPSVVTTVAEEGRLLQMYERYAKNTATSEVAVATNTNRPLP